MNYLLDTNVVSEWVKPRPDPGVASWLAEADEDRLYLSVMTLTELRYGIERLPDGARRKRLDSWLSNDMPFRFEGRVVPIDGEVAASCGRIMARRESMGVPIGMADAFIAATAVVHACTLVTRNVSDFKPSIASIISPWTT